MMRNIVLLLKRKYSVKNLLICSLWNVNIAKRSFVVSTTWLKIMVVVSLQRYKLENSLSNNLKRKTGLMKKEKD